MRTRSAFMRHAGPIRTTPAAVVAVIVAVSIVVRVLILIAVAILLAGRSRLIVACGTRLRVIVVRGTRRPRVLRRIRSTFMRYSRPVRTSTTPVIIVIVPVVAVPILILTVVRILLPMAIVVTAPGMREVASSIGYWIAVAIVVPIAVAI